MAESRLLFDFWMTHFPEICTILLLVRISFQRLFLPKAAFAFSRHDDRKRERKRKWRRAVVDGKGASLVGQGLYEQTLPQGCKMYVQSLERERYFNHKEGPWKTRKYWEPCYFNVRLYRQRESWGVPYETLSGLIFLGYVKKAESPYFMGDTMLLDSLAKVLVFFAVYTLKLLTSFLPLSNGNLFLRY